MSSEPRRKKTSYAYAWSGQGDIYDQAYALNRGRYRRAQEQARTDPDLPVEQRKQSAMTVIASSPEVLEELRQKHEEKRQEIAQSRIDYPRDVEESKDELARTVRAEADRNYGWYNPLRYLYRHWGARSSTAYASDSPEVAHRRAVVRANESMVAGLGEEEHLHANMRFIRMGDLDPHETGRTTRKLHLLGHGGPDFPAFTTVQNPTKMHQYKLFDDLAKEFKQQGVLDRFTDLRMESCWSANPVRTDIYSKPDTYQPVIATDTSVKRAPGVHLQRQLKAVHPDQPFQIKAYEGRGSQLSNPIGQKQRNLTNPMETVRQSTVAHTFTHLDKFD